MKAERHLLHVFSTFGRGGPQVRAAQLMARMPVAWRHSVVAMDGDTGCRDQVGGEVAVEVLEPPRGRGWRVARSMGLLMRDRSFDLVLTYNWGAIETVLGARWCGQAVVHHEDGFGVEERVRRLRRRSWARRWLLGRCAAVIVPSATLLGIAGSEWGLRKNLHHLPNGVDLERFRPAGERGAGPVVVGHVGQLRREKNQALLLTAVAQMSEACTVEVVGDGPERLALESLTEELGLSGRVSFRGVLGDPAERYRQWDIFALSSHTEQMPLSVLEAMASGLPVVSTRVGDVPEMLGAAARDFLVEPDAKALAGALDRLIADAELRAEVGNSNRRRCADRYELEASLARYLAVYQGALGAGG